MDFWLGFLLGFVIAVVLTIVLSALVNSSGVDDNTKPQGCADCKHLSCDGCDMYEEGRQ